MHRAFHQCSAMLIKHLAQEETPMPPAIPKVSKQIHLLLMAKEWGALSLSIPHSLGCSGSKSSPEMSGCLAGSGKSWQHKDRENSWATNHWGLAELSTAESKSSLGLFCRQLLWAPSLSGYYIALALVLFSRTHPFIKRKNFSSSLEHSIFDCPAWRSFLFL